MTMSHAVVPSCDAPIRAIPQEEAKSYKPRDCAVSSSSEPGLSWVSLLLPNPSFTSSLCASIGHAPLEAPSGSVLGRRGFGTSTCKGKAFLDALAEARSCVARGGGGSVRAAEPAIYCDAAHVRACDE